PDLLDKFDNIKKTLEKVKQASTKDIVPPSNPLTPGVGLPPPVLASLSKGLKLGSVGGLDGGTMSLVLACLAFSRVFLMLSNLAGRSGTSRAAECLPLLRSSGNCAGTGITSPRLAARIGL